MSSDSLRYRRDPVDAGGEQHGTQRRGGPGRQLDAGQQPQLAAGRPGRRTSPAARSPTARRAPAAAGSRAGRPAAAGTRPAASPPRSSPSSSSSRTATNPTVVPVDSWSCASASGTRQPSRVRPHGCRLCPSVPSRSKPSNCSSAGSPASASRHRGGPGRAQRGVDGGPPGVRQRQVHPGVGQLGGHRRSVDAQVGQQPLGRSGHRVEQLDLVEAVPQRPVRAAGQGDLAPVRPGGPDRAAARAGQVLPVRGGQQPAGDHVGGLAAGRR